MNYIKHYKTLQMFKFYFYIRKDKHFDPYGSFDRNFTVNIKNHSKKTSKAIYVEINIIE